MSRCAQNPALSLYLLSVEINEVMKEIQREVPWCIMFVDDIVSVGENSDEENQRLDV